MATFNERLAREFIAQGHEVTNLTFSLQYPSFLFPGKTQMSSEKAPEDLSIDVAINSINPFNWFRVGRKYNKMKPDLVIFRYWMPFMAPCLGTIARIIRKNRHSKIVAITDNIIPHEKRIGDGILTSYFLKPIKAYVAMSRSVLDDISKFNTTKPRKYIPHPLYDNFGPAIEKQVAKQKLELEADVNYIMFFGFIRAYKGLDLLLKSLSKVEMKKHNIKLLVAGEFYGDSKPYLDLIRALGLEGSIELHTRFIENDQVPLYFSAADLVVQTYKTATQSGVTQIAYFYKKPMLVTNVGGLAELVPDKKVGYVTERDEVQIANAISDFYANNREEKMIECTLSEREKYTWSGLTNELINISSRDMKN